MVFKHACALGCEGIVSKRLGSRYRSVHCMANSAVAWRAPQSHI